MRRILLFCCLVLVPLAPLLAAQKAAAASGVRDQAHYFTAPAISQAEEIIRQINHRHNKDVLVETLPEVPQDLRPELEVKGKEKFFEDWADQRYHQQGVNGVYVLICKEPSHLEAAVGSNTSQHLFTVDDRVRLVRGMLDYFKKKDFDQGLIHGVQFVETQMDAHHAGAASSAAQSDSTPPTAYPPTNQPSSDRNVRTGWGIGGVACIVIGVILLIILIRGIFGRSGGRYYGGPGGYPPPGGTYPPGGYPPSGGYGYGSPGGGGGFGRGFLGGLLGGALGGWALNKWEQNQQGGLAPPASGSQDYSSGVDTSVSSSGGDFGSSDASSSGGDFGGGGDSGSSGGGSDFGAGGDFSGGGGDFGGGGDSGSSGGGDF